MGATGTPPRDRAHDDLDLLSTRFAVPTVASDVLPRRRLLDDLQAGAAGPLTLLSAPAGCGKTTLVATWTALHDLPGSLTWMTLESGDEQPDAFWPHLVEGLRRSGLPDLPSMPSASGDDLRRAALARLAAGIAAFESPVVLVLDDADLVPDPGVWREVGDLLARTAGRLHLVLLTRRDPTLHLARMRLDGAVTEIRMADLAFTELEARTFLDRAGIRLLPAEVAALMERTGGWPAGIRFAAMSLVGRADKAEAIAELSGADGNVAEYLFAEVLNQQSPAMREVLLRSSIVDTLRPGLLEALTGSPADQRDRKDQADQADQAGRCTVDVVARGNAFLLPVPGTSGCYRYQPLFRDLLRAQLTYEQPSLVPPLHRAAAGWLAEHGELLDALRHAAAGQDWPAAAGFVVDGMAVGQLLSLRGNDALQRVMRDLPDDEGGAAGAVVRAALALRDGELSGCLEQLARAGAALDDEPVQRARTSRVTTVALTALVTERTGDLAGAMRSVDEADRLLAAAGTVDVLELRAQVGLCRARLLVRRGDLELARAVLADMVAVAGEAGCSGLVAEGLGLTALLEAVSGNLSRAVELARRTVVDADQAGTGCIANCTVPAAAVALAWVATERSDVRAARDLACRADVTVNRTHDPVTAAALELVHRRLQTIRGGSAAGGTDAEPAAWLAETVHGADVGPEAEIDPARPSAAVAGLVRAADHAIGRGEVDRARRILGRSLDLAAPEQLRRPFLQAPGPVQQLLRAGTGLAARHPWLRPTAPDGPDDVDDLDDLDDAAGLVVEPLTAREQEVLGHLAELLTTEEIAEAMFVSVNTVRTHVRGVLRKLAVTRRHQAVRRAWQLGLLQRSSVGGPSVTG